MTDYEGTLTKFNLDNAYAMEAMARNKYTIYASRAKKEGLEQIAALFLQAANNEYEHSKIWFKELYTDKSTLDNLYEAAAHEHDEAVRIYESFAYTAEMEGFDELAEKFRKIALIEQNHEDMYRKLIKNLEDGQVFARDGVYIWECRNCGQIVISDTAPERCPACDHPQAFFEIKANNY